MKTLVVAIVILPAGLRGGRHQGTQGTQQRVAEDVSSQRDLRHELRDQRVITLLDLPGWLLELRPLFH